MNKLAQACELSLNDWSATFSETIPEPVYSKKYKRWKKKLFDKMRDDHYHIFTTKAIKVMWIAAIISMMLLTAFVIPSSREYILEEFDKNSTYELTMNNKNSVSGEINVGYIPNGFDLKESICEENLLINRYVNGNGDIITVFKYSSIMKIDFDTERFEVENVTIDTIQYVYCTGYLGMNSIIWNKNDYIYQIDALLEKEEMIKIAKTVE